MKGLPGKSAASRVAGLIGIFLFLAALRFLHRAVSGFRFDKIALVLRDLPRGAFVKALLLTGTDYLVLTGYDWLAVKYINRPIRYARCFFAAFVTCAFSNSLGFAAITAGSLRFRLYSNWGFSGVEIAKIVSFCNVTVWLGLAAAAGVSFITRPRLIASQGFASLFATRIGGACLLCFAAAYLLLCVFHRRSYSFRRWNFALPSLPLSVGQILTSCIDWALAGGVLYALLPAHSTIAYFQFLTVFLLAQTAGILSQAPGGIGVQESVAMVFLLPFAPARGLVASFVAYRAIYYLLPLALAAGLFGLREARDRGRQIGRLAGPLGKRLRRSGSAC